MEPRENVLGGPITKRDDGRWECAGVIVVPSTLPCYPYVSTE